MMPLHLRAAFWVFTVCTLGLVTSAWIAAAENDPSAMEPDRHIKPGAIIVRAQWQSRALEVITALHKAFPQSGAYDIGGDDKAFLPRFCDSDAPFDILVTSDLALARGEGWALSAMFPAGKPQPLKIPIGQLRVILVVSSSNPVETIELSKIRELLGATASGKSWRELLETESSGRMKCYGPSPEAPAAAVVRNKCLEHWKQIGKYAKQLHIDTFRSDMQICDNVKAVLNGVKATKLAGLGIVDVPGAASANWTGLKPLAIGVNPSTSVRPDLAPVIQLDYPLAETITLYVHPKAIAQTEDFVRFCVSQKGAEICSKYGLISPYYEAEKLAKKRLADAKAGKGEGIVICDLIGKEKMLKDLATEFVKAKATVQLKFVGDEGRGTKNGKSTNEALEKLDKGAIELLLTDGGNRQQLANDKAAKQNSPTPYAIELGRLAVGVIVHPDNPLRLLPTSEVRDIFCGKIKQWPASRGVAATMHVYGLQPRDPASQLFKERLVEPSYPSSPAARLTLKYSARADNAAVILTVAHDPAAIGFVNLSQLPENEKSVKLVPVGEGPEVSGQGSAAANQKSLASNPFEQIFTLFVSPKAGQAAKDFAAYLTPEHCRELIAQNNLLPPLRPENTLADEHHPLSKGNGTELASADKAEPLLLDESEVFQNQKVKSRRQAAKNDANEDSDLEAGNEDGAKFRNKDSRAVTSKPELAKSRRPLLHNGVAPEPESTPKRPEMSALSSEQAVLLAGGVIGVVLLAVGIGWLRAPHRKKVRR